MRQYLVLFTPPLLVDEDHVLQCLGNVSRSETMNSTPPVMCHYRLIEGHSPNMSWHTYYWCNSLLRELAHMMRSGTKQTQTCQLLTSIRCKQTNWIQNLPDSHHVTEPWEVVVKVYTHTHTLRTSLLSAVPSVLQYSRWAAVGPRPAKWRGEDSNGGKTSESFVGGIKLKAGVAICFGLHNH